MNKPRTHYPLFGVRAHPACNQPWRMRPNAVLCMVEEQNTKYKVDAIPNQGEQLVGKNYMYR